MFLVQTRKLIYKNRHDPYTICLDKFLWKSNYKAFAQCYNQLAVKYLRKYFLQRLPEK